MRRGAGVAGASPLAVGCLRLAPARSAPAATLRIGDPLWLLFVGSSSLLTDTGDLLRALLLTVSLVGDPLRPRLSADLSLALFACVLFLGVGLMVSSANDMSTPSLGAMSSPPFTLHEIEQ